MNTDNTFKPPRKFSILLCIIAAPMVLGGLQLIFLGGTFYYLLAGLALVASAICLWRGAPLGSLIYGGLLIVTLVWALMESGTHLWALATRILPLAVLGLYLLTPSVRRSLYLGTAPPLLQSTASRGVIAVVSVVAIYVVLNGVGYEVNPLTERSGISTVNTRSDWPSYGNDDGGSRYSPLAEISRDNVQDLEVAWVHRTGIGGTFKATPLQVGELLYSCTGGNVLIALNANSGELEWQFDPLIASEQMNPPLTARRYFTTGCRGVAYFEAPSDYQGDCQQRILTATTDARLIAVDALSGERCHGFGDLGEVNLTRHMGNDPLSFNYQTSPPAIVRGKVVVGGFVQDGYGVGQPSGVVRAFDAISGDFAWAWDMGRPGITSEPLAGEVYTRGTPNVWSNFSVDEELGLIYAPTGNETPDYFGSYRMEASEQYASSVVAIEGDTGLPRWSFQTVHHDLWDYDVPAQPVLIDLPDENGNKQKAVLVPTKRSEVFVLNRETGEPFFDIQELPVPQEGGVPEDWVAPTQPFAVDLPHFREDLSEQKMWGLTPLDQLWCRIEYKKMRYDGHLTVPGTDSILQYPGPWGGYNWGSVSVDQLNNLMIVNPVLVGYHLTLIPRDQLPPGEEGRQRGTPYSYKNGSFMSPIGIPCNQPPYGMLAAIDLETRQLLWKRPIGDASHSGPSVKIGGEPIGIKSHLPISVGTPQLGGTVTTGGGVIFMSGTFDNTVRAVDVLTGEELWRADLPQTAHATPMTYRTPGGQQTLIVTVPVYNTTLGAATVRVLPQDQEDPEGGYIIAYRLPN